jgi:hypothetical protein
MLASLFFLEDPKKGSSGSSFITQARSGDKTQYVPRRQLLFLLYIVFTHCPATGCAGADIAALLISPPWYTSGKL